MYKLKNSTYLLMYHYLIHKIVLGTHAITGFKRKSTIMILIKNYKVSARPHGHVNLITFVCCQTKPKLE